MAKIKPGKHVEKKDLITLKAASLFRTGGYTATSMRELAEMVGVEAPSLYNYIGSKSELLQLICFKVAAQFTSQLELVEKKPVTNAEKIGQVIRFHISMMLDEFDEVFVANHEWKHLPEPHLANFLNQRRLYEKRLVALVEEGILAKEFKKLNPYVVVLTILSAVRGLEFWQRHKKNVSPKVLENDMVQHLLNGILK